MKLDNGFRDLFGFWRCANRTADTFSRVEPAIDVQTGNPIREIPRRVSCDIVSGSFEWFSRKIESRIPVERDESDDMEWSGDAFLSSGEERGRKGGCWREGKP